MYIYIFISIPIDTPPYTPKTPCSKSPSVSRAILRLLEYR